MQVTLYVQVFSLKKSEIRFAIIVIYVNNLNLVRTREKLIKIVSYLKK